jgi:hypothetical protein
MVFMEEPQVHALSFAPVFLNPLPSAPQSLHDVPLTAIPMNRFLDLLLSNPCSHEFCWPRRTATGAYYQVCLRCGDHYWYDWKKMRRTDLIDPAEHLALAQPIRTRWAPRARRLSVSVELQFRRKSSEEWTDGNITNISQSGVLFTGPSGLHLPRHAALELMFEMPSQISGQPHSRVLCDAYVVRSTPDGREHCSIAAAILEYKFLHSQQPVVSVSSEEQAAPAQPEPFATNSTVSHRRRFRPRRANRG